MTPQAPDPTPRRDNGGLKTLVQAEKYLQIAIMLPASLFIGYIIGYWLDKVLHQTWMNIAGLIFGAAAGLFSVVRIVLHAGKDGAGDI